MTLHIRVNDHSRGWTYLFVKLFLCFELAIVETHTFASFDVTSCKHTSTVNLAWPNLTRRNAAEILRNKLYIAEKTFYKQNNDPPRVASANVRLIPTLFMSDLVQR